MAEVFVNRFVRDLTADYVAGSGVLHVNAAAPAGVQGGTFRVRLVNANNTLLIVNSGADTTTWNVTAEDFDYNCAAAAEAVLACEITAGFIDAIRSAGAVAGQDTWVQYNDQMAAGASSFFTYNKNTKTLSVDTIQLDAASPNNIISSGNFDVDATGYVSCDKLAANNGISCASLAQNAIEATRGGVTGLYLVARDSLFFLQEVQPQKPAQGQSRMYMDSTTRTLKVSQDGNDYVDVVSTGGGGGVAKPAGAPGQVQYNYDNNVLGASSYFTYTIASKTLGVDTIQLNAVAPNNVLSSANVFIAADGSVSCVNLSATAAVNVTQAASSTANSIQTTGGVKSYSLTLTGTGTDTIISSAKFFVDAGGIVSATRLSTTDYITTSSSLTNAVSAPSGGVSALWLVASDSVIWIEESAPPLSDATPGRGQSRIYMDKTSHILMVSQYGSAYVPLVGGGGGSQWVTSGNDIYYSTGRVGIGSGSAWTLSSPNLAVFSRTALGTAAGNNAILATFGITTSNSTTFAIKAQRNTAGTDWSTAAIGLTMDVDASPSAGGSIWFKSGYIGIGMIPGQPLDVLGVAQVASIQVHNGWIDSQQGFYSSYSASYQTISCPNGGVYGRSLRASVYTQLGQNSFTPSPTGSGAGQDTLGNGAIYYDTSALVIKALVNGSWQTVMTGGTYVTSITGTSPISVSPVSGAPVVSISATPSFTSVTCSNYVNCLRVQLNGVTTLDYQGGLQNVSAVYSATFGVSGQGDAHDDTGIVVQLAAGGSKTLIFKKGLYYG